MIVPDVKIIECELINALDVRVDHKLWKRPWPVLKLFMKGLNVILVHMRVSQHVDQLPRLQIAYLNQKHSLTAVEKCLDESAGIAALIH